MRLRSSTKIAIAFGLVVAVAVVGMRVYSDYRVGQLHFPEIKPGRVNLVGVSLGPRFKIIVANHAAQLVELQSGAEKGIDAVGSETSLVKRRVPIHELLKSLQGDEETLGRLLMIVNERSEDLLPPERVYWTAADLNKALGGDPTLQAKLEADLNVRLDGTPLPELRIKSIEDGIIIKAPVAVGARIAGRERTLHGTLLLPFKPRLVTRVEEGYREKTNADRTMIEGLYQTEGALVLKDPGRRENVRASLKALIAEDTLREYASPVEKLLSGMTVVVNEDQIEGVSYRKYTEEGRQFFDLTVKLASEGSDRLWKYSKGRVGSQLMLVVDGVAIAAPRISHELSQSDLTITQLPEQVLVDMTVDAIKARRNPLR